MNLYWGNSVNISISITEGEDRTPKDCTGLDCKLVIKETDQRSAPLILSKAINWTGQSIGEGYFTITASDSEGLSVKNYYMEIILYKSDNSYRKTVYKGRLNVKQSLGLN